jgi:2-oxoglutarate ferredoxin oxidoreductase subunit alpha
MSPSSTILSHLANWAEKTGMHVEQVEDEISVSQMTLGASFAGTRSLCATSGGGYDLMTETVSLAGMIETPLTVIVAQRPGPATGLPTWSGQEDLNLAIYSGHGEYAKAVIAVGDHAEAFKVLGEALNIAETYQIPVIVLTDKTLAETNATVDPASLIGVEIERGLTEVQKAKGKEQNDGFDNNSAILNFEF